MSENNKEKKHIHVRLNQQNSDDVRAICAEIGRADLNAELVNKIVSSVPKSKKFKIAEEIKLAELRESALKDPAVMAKLDELIKNNIKK